MRSRDAVRPGLMALALLLPPALLAQPGADSRQLDGDAYRTELEEIIVRGVAPRWTGPDEELGADTRFRLPEHTSPPPLQLFPAYDKEEHEQYRSVRDRKGETPEIRLFELQF